MTMTSADSTEEYYRRAAAVYAASVAASSIKCPNTSSAQYSSAAFPTSDTSFYAAPLHAVPTALPHLLSNAPSIYSSESIPSSPQKRDAVSG